MHNDRDIFDQAAQETIELGNRLADHDRDADIWDIADGLLAGAVQFWLYSRQPCADPSCEDCAPISTAEARLQRLLQDVGEQARQSEYFHSPNDLNAGRA